MTLTEMDAAIKEAKAEIDRAEWAIRDNIHIMARLLQGRLHWVNKENTLHNANILRKLKKELSKFNSHDGTWR